MRLAMLISPSRVNSSTVPISRMYIRTGSVVRPGSFSTDASTAAASSSATSSVASADSPNMVSSDSGARSCTGIPTS